jgi:hypothetical protein
LDAVRDGFVLAFETVVKSTPTKDTNDRFNMKQTRGLTPFSTGICCLRPGLVYALLTRLSSQKKQIQAIIHDY